MFALKTHNIRYAPTVHRVAALFTRDEAPRGRKWAHNWRPMRTGSAGLRAAHLRFEKHDGYYVAHMYQTDLVKYFEPALDGSTRIEVYWPCGYDNMSTRGVLNALGFSAKAWIGNVCIMPSYERDGLSAVLTYDARGCLVPHESFGLQLCQTVASDEDKARRKAFYKRIEPLVLMAEAIYASGSSGGEAGRFTKYVLDNILAELDEPGSRLCVDDDMERFRWLCHELKYSAVRRRRWEHPVMPDASMEPFSLVKFRGRLKAKLLQLAGLDKPSGTRLLAPDARPRQPQSTGRFPEGVNPRRPNG